jgi:hypothetical protein
MRQLQAKVVQCNVFDTEIAEFIEIVLINFTPRNLQLMWGGFHFDINFFSVSLSRRKSFKLVMII